MAFTLSKEITNEYDETTVEAKEKSRESLKVSAKKHLLFIQDMYVKQKDGIPIRIKKRRSELIGAIVILAIVFLIMVAAIAIFRLIGIFLCAFMVWAIYYTLRDSIKSSIRYLIMTESKAFGFYKRYTDSFTYVSEEHFCQQKIKEIDELLKQIDMVKDEEVEAYCTNLLTYQYEEKRAYSVLGPADQRLI